MNVLGSTITNNKKFIITVILQFIFLGLFIESSVTMIQVLFNSSLPPKDEVLPTLLFILGFGGLLISNYKMSDYIDE